MIQHNVLVIAFIFPPLGGSGVQRTLKFTKYLPDFNWRPYVVCSDDPHSIGNGIDTSLLDEVPTEVRIWRRSFINPMGLRRRAYKLLGMKPQDALQPDDKAASSIRLVESEQPASRNKLRRLLQETSRLLKPFENPPIDPAIYWSLAIVPGCLKWIRKEKIELIYSSSYPYSDHITAWILKRITGLPWVADFRDPWSQNALHKNTGWRFRVDRWMERNALKTADKVICITPPYTQGLYSLAPERKREDFITIENGFDPDDFKPINSQTILGINIDTLVLSHVGILYDGFALPLFEALDKLGDSAQPLHFRFIGGLASLETNWLNNHKTAATIEIQPRLPHPEAIVAMQSSKILLLLINDDMAWKGVYPGKLFEYMASGVPIFMIGPDGAASELIRRSRTGCCFVPSDVDGIANALLLMITDYQQFCDKFYQPKHSLINSFQRRVLTSKLVGIFNEVLMTS